MDLENTMKPLDYLKNELSLDVLYEKYESHLKKDQRVLPKKDLSLKNLQLYTILKFRAQNASVAAAAVVGPSIPAQEQNEKERDEEEKKIEVASTQKIEENLIKVHEELKSLRAEFDRHLSECKAKAAVKSDQLPIPIEVARRNQP